MVIGDIVVNNARLYPDKTGIIDERCRFTWEEVNRRVNRLANALGSLGLVKGDRVMMVGENGHEFAEFLFAVAKAGLTGVPVNYRFMPDKLAVMIGDCRPKLILAQDKFAPAINPAALDIGARVITIGKGGEYEALINAAQDNEPWTSVSEQDVYLVSYSTGTTGIPKGIELTHKNWITNCVIRMMVTRLSENEVYITPVPLFATGGLGHFLSACFGGMTVVVVAFSPESVAGMISREKVTVAFFTPTTYKILRDYLEKSARKYDLSSLKHVAIAGGQPCGYHLVKEILDYFRITYVCSSKTYGMSETATCGTWLMPGDMAAGLGPGASEKERGRIDSVGKAVGDTRVRVVDENDRDLPPLEIGEILLRGDGVMKGYLNQPKITAQTLRGGWYHTSDMGYLDEEGYLYFSGRRDFLIKSGGFFVAPEDVEKVLAGHPAVAEAAVLGVPDEKWGQQVKAVVVLKPGMAAAEDELRDYCRDYLAGFQVPKSVIFAVGLPREKTYGKLDRQEILRQYGS